MSLSMAHPDRRRQVARAGRNLTAFVAGGVFGIGMTLSGMTDPARVIGFFDLLGAWDPTLAFVMAGALLPMALAWRIARHRSASLLGEPLPPPPSPRLDARLIGGAILFGLGWGLVGLCPGAVVPAASFGGGPVLIFLAALLGGLLLVRTLLPKA